MSDQEAREILGRVAELLRKQQLPLPVNGEYVPVPWANKAAEAIESVLTGEVQSLDAAFKLKRGRGRPADDTRRETIARETNTLRRSGKSWKETADALSEKGISLDESVLREYFKEFEPQIKTEEQAATIIRDILSGKK